MSGIIVRGICPREAGMAGSGPVSTTDVFTASRCPSRGRQSLSDQLFALERSDSCCRGSVVRARDAINNQENSPRHELRA